MKRDFVKWSMTINELKGNGNDTHDMRMRNGFTIGIKKTKFLLECKEVNMLRKIKRLHSVRIRGSTISLKRFWQ